ncbi:M16 family metallopeptidase [Nibricoccus sp. IMCC34717]|uniref:M16 family metallopeptidase n=1 Tax=Nibricoccus sp. IMCC34717 TaxID=3034021 RepID=UPI00384F4C29
MSRPREADFGLLKAFFEEKPLREVLPNGVVVVAKEDFSSPVVSVQVWVRTGSIHEDELAGSGVSHFVEHMLFKGTTRRAGREISATVQAHGGSINAYTTFDRTVYHVDLPAEHLAVGLDVLSDMVLDSVFPEAEVVKEREVILREIDMGRDDPESRFSELLFETAFRTHPHRHPIIGHREVFASLTRDDLVGYYRERYAPNNLVVVIAGAIEAAEALRSAAEKFGAAARRRLAPLVLPVEPAVLAPRAVHREEDVDVCRAALSWHIPGITHGDAVALDLLAVVLGGGESSELWQTVRECERLVHAIDAYCWTPAETGLFSISFVGERADRDRAIARVRELLADAMRRGFGDGELARAKRQMIVGEVNGRKTMAGQAGRLGVAETVAGDLDFNRAYFARLERLDSAALVRVMERYLRAEAEIRVSQNPRIQNTDTVAPPPRAAASSLSFERIDLPNGVRLLLQENKTLPLVHVRAGFLGAALAEPEEARGATALMATLLTKDTARHSAAEVAATIEGVGGAFHPFSGNSTFGMAVEVLNTDLAVGLGLLRDALEKPLFVQRTFEIERDAQVAALRQEDDDVVSYARRRLREHFFGSHPLAVGPSGRIADLTALTPEALRKLWQRCSGAENLVIAVAGDFDRGKLLAELTPWLSKRARGTFTPNEPVWPGLTASVSLQETVKREQAVVLQAFPGPGVRSEDFEVGEVADELFSGMSSRLFERVREDKGLAYFVRSSRTVGFSTGMFAFLAGTRPDKADEVLAEMDAEIARIAAGDVSDEELQRCRTRLKAGRKMALQTNGSRAMLALTNTLLGFPANDWLQYDERIDAVTRDDLRKFAAERLSAATRVRLVVGP